MIFKRKKSDEKIRCENCGKNTSTDHNFCPFCGNSFADPNKEKKDYGMLGRNDNIPEEQFTNTSFGLTDKLINSMINSMMRSLDKQFQNQFKELEKDFDRAEVRNLPNGIRIKLVGPGQAEPKVKKEKPAAPQRKITDVQIQKMNSLPRGKAKTNIKRLGDKVVYELDTPGISSAEDVFVSKLESGYEVKVIGEKKVFVNSIPINLPIKRYAIMKNKLLLEFKQENEEFQAGQ